MSRASNSLRASDVTATPITLKYSSSYSNTTICDSGIYAKGGVNGPVTVTGSLPGETLRYWSARHLFYSNFLTGSYLTTTSSLENYLQSTAASGTFEGNTAASASADIRVFPTESGAKVKIINIPRSAYGQQLSKKNFFMASADETSYRLVDDGNGNVVDTLNNNVHVGNIIYPQGIILITNQDYYCVMDGGPVTFPKSYIFDVSDNPKTFNPILGAIPDCAPIVSSSLQISEFPYYSFPDYTIDGFGNVTLDENDTITNKVGTYKAYYTLSSTYCGVSDPQPITIQIIDVGVYDVIFESCSVSVSPSPSVTPSVTPSVSITPTISVSATPSPSVTPSISTTPGLTPTPSPSVTPSVSVTPSATPSISVTPSVSITPSPSPSAGTVYSDNYDLSVTELEICTSPVGAILYTTTNPFGTGAIMYTDPGLTTPVAGYNYIKVGAGSIIYNIDSVTGQVGSTTGNSC